VLPEGASSVVPEGASKEAETLVSKKAEVFSAKVALLVCLFDAGVEDNATLEESRPVEVHVPKSFSELGKILTTRHLAF
jgi:hypothetical protein